MPLFQKSVLKRYLAELPQAQILSSYQVFQNIFNHKEIDYMVYELYELTEEEIRIVEGL